jgi:hypothetical protein
MSIKIERAMKLASAGNFPATFSGLLAHIPQGLVDTMTSRQLASTIDALYTCAQESKAFAAREAINNGFIWDARQNRSRDIAA